MKKIKEFINKLLSGKMMHILIAIILIGSCIYGLLVTRDYYRRQVRITETNYRAAMDSLRYYKLKTGQTAAEKTLYITTEKNMPQAAGITKDEYKELKKTLGDISTLAQTTSQANISNIDLPSTQIKSPDSTRIDFRWADKWNSINGYSVSKNDLAYTHIDSFKINTTMKMGLTKDNQFFVVPDNPYIHVSNIQGASLSTYLPKKKRFSIGFSAGYGGFYDVTRKNIGTGPYIGFGMNIILF